MKLSAYSVRDESAQSFGTPFYAQTELVAIRSFKMLIDDERSTVYHYPGDFSLYHLGYFDDETGILEPIHPVSVVRGDSMPQNKEVPHV